MAQRIADAKTLGDILRIVESIDNEADAQDFMGEYLKITPHAAENIGYATGYYDAKTAARIRKLFKVTHPVFGDTRPTPSEAFAAGMAIGEKEKSHG
jgi:hypothetical protein